MTVSDEPNCVHKRSYFVSATDSHIDEPDIAFQPTAGEQLAADSVATGQITEMTAWSVSTGRLSVKSTDITTYLSPCVCNTTFCA